MASLRRFRFRDLYYVVFRAVVATSRLEFVNPTRHLDSRFRISTVLYGLCVRIAQCLSCS